MPSEPWEQRTYHQDYRGAKVINPYPSLLVGCPVQRREWIIEDWWDSVVKAARRQTDDFGFIFVIDKTDPTYERICTFADRDRISTFFVFVEEEQRQDKRRWTKDRYDKMVFLRNLLLSWVRKIGPDFFLSLDSDILLHEDAIMVLYETIGDWDAIGGKAFLTPTGVNCPTFGCWKGDPENGRYRRENRDYICKVDVLMAVKLMTPAAYWVDYEYARQGEDIGWSLACWRKGLSFGWNGTVINRHVMSPDKLGKDDVRIDNVR